jgi:nondiscriminating glutamyl-tRNA synthetase
MEDHVRVRFAPSPTGHLHVGNARTALFNFLFARNRGGTYILRLEDTDLERSTAEAEKAILEDLAWLGLEWDEGPNRPGAYGPYRQSERLEIYRRYAQILLEKGDAYRCFCTPEELEEKRNRAIARGIPPKYDGACRNLPEEEARALFESGRPFSLRYRVDARTILFEDLVKNRMSFDGQKIGDFIILRSDGVAPYNFAVVIDDALMEITHVIRGEDHLANTARQILLYKALGFPLPQFAHLSMILGPDRSPLSKRHGATAVDYFREEGYMPEALINYLALLGWSAEDGQEILKMEDLVQRFSLKRVSRSSAVFDLDKLKWVNRAHLKFLSGEEALRRALPFLRPEKNAIPGGDSTWLQASLESVLGEVDTLRQLPEKLRVFTDDEMTFHPEAERLLAKKESRKVIREFAEALTGVEKLTAENSLQMLSALGKKLKISGRDLYLPVRAAVTGQIHGPELEKIFVLLGKDRLVRRVESVMQRSEGERSRPIESE